MNLCDLYFLYTRSIQLYTFICSIKTFYMTLHIVYDSICSIYTFYTTLQVLYNSIHSIYTFYTLYIFMHSIYTFYATLHFLYDFIRLYVLYTRSIRVCMLYMTLHVLYDSIRFVYTFYTFICSIYKFYTFYKFYTTECVIYIYRYIYIYTILKAPVSTVSCVIVLQKDSYLFGYSTRRPAILLSNAPTLRISAPQPVCPPSSRSHRTLTLIQPPSSISPPRSFLLWYPPPSLTCSLSRIALSRRTSSASPPSTLTAGAWGCRRRRQGYSTRHPAILLSNAPTL
jgi:hypothetical protein